MGVVDVNHLFENYHKTATFEGELKKSGEKLGRGIKVLEEKIDSLRGDLGLLVPGNATYEELEKKIFSLIQEHKFEVNRAKRTVNDSRVEFRDQIIKELRKSVDDYGKKHHYDLIIQKELTRSGNLSWRAVLYHGEGVDITPVLLQSINP